MIQAFIDFIFPPYCLSCKERCSTQVLCPHCWLLCKLPDPIERCRHCFEELEKQEAMCSRCRNRPILLAVRGTVFDPESPAVLLGLDALDALAGFAILQWMQLEWPLPDAVIPMPDSVPLAKAFAQILDRPFVRALTATHEYREKTLEENGHLLLIDIANPLVYLQKATAALANSFPKRIYLLTLFPSSI